MVGRTATVRRRVVVWVLIWLLTLVGLRATLWAAEICPPITAVDAREAAEAAGQWIVANQEPSGRWLYEWNRVTEQASSAYNLVRHAGTTMALYQLVDAGDTSVLDGADLATEWMLALDITEGAPAAEGLEIAAFAEPGDPGKLGTASLVAVGLAQRRLATDDPRHDDLLRRLGRFIIGQQRPDGSMLDLWDPDTGPVPDRTSLFATGEALWALALLDDLFPGEGWGAAAMVTMDYVATDRDDDEDVWPRPWADQWAAYSLRQLDGELEGFHLDYARTLAAQWGVATRWESQRNGGIDELVHAPEPIAAGQGTWLEGLGALRELAESDPRLADISDDLADRLACGAGRMVAKQVTGTGVVELDGAWFVDDVSRVDGQQHALSGLLLAERLLTASSGDDTADSAAGERPTDDQETPR